MTHYASNTQLFRGTDHLFNLKQSPRLTLCKFIHCFVIEMMQVENNDLKIVMVAFWKALLHENLLLWPLAKNGLTMMKTLLSKANWYANMEKKLRALENKWKVSQVEHTQEWGSQTQKKQGTNKKPPKYLTNEICCIEFTISPRKLLAKLKDEPNS